MAIVFRSLNVRQYKRPESYKRYLRHDFLHRCGYCTVHEGEFDSGGLKSFCVDHFRPKSLFKELACVYSNLYYACRHCNENKGNHWPTKEVEEAGFRYLDPCVDDYYKHHFIVRNDGELVPQSKSATYTIEHLRLNRKYLKRLRISRNQVAKQIASVRMLLKQLEISGITASSPVEAVINHLTELERKHLFPPIPYELDEQR